MSLQFTFDKSVLRIQHYFQTRDATIKQALIDKMFFMMQKLEQKIVNEKLTAESTGEDTLQTDSGKLALSIQAQDVKVKGGAVTGGVMQNPRTAPYGIYHLKGGMRAYRIPNSQTAQESRKKALHFFWQDKEWFRAWVMRKPLKRRDFMTSAFLEMQDEITRELRQAVYDAMQPDFEGY